MCNYSKSSYDIVSDALESSYFCLNGEIPLIGIEKENNSFESYNIFSEKKCLFKNMCILPYDEHGKESLFLDYFLKYCILK